MPYLVTCTWFFILLEIQVAVVRGLSDHVIFVGSDGPIRLAASFAKVPYSLRLVYLQEP